MQTIVYPIASHHNSSDPSLILPEPHNQGFDATLGPFPCVADDNFSVQLNDVPLDDDILVKWHIVQDVDSSFSSSPSGDTSPRGSGSNSSFGALDPDRLLNVFFRQLQVGVPASTSEEASESESSLEGSPEELTEQMDQIQALTDMFPHTKAILDTLSSLFGHGLREMSKVEIGVVTDAIGAWLQEGDAESGDDVGGWTVHGLQGEMG